MTMDYLNLTQEERKKLKQEWLSMYSTEEILSSRSPSEIVSYISQDQIIANLNTHQLTSLAEKLNSRIQVKSY
jgi:hypothetical protein